MIEPWSKVTAQYRLKRGLRFLWQRLTRGWDDSETWGLDATAARWLLPRLIRFRELNQGFWHDTKEETDAALAEAQWFLEVHASEEGTWQLYGAGNEEKLERYKKASAEFGETFAHMWW